MVVVVVVTAATLNQKHLVIVSFELNGAGDVKLWRVIIMIT